MRSYRVVGEVSRQALQTMCMEHGGLHAYFNRREAIPSTAESGSAKPSGSGQAAPSLEFWVR